MTPKEYLTQARTLDVRIRSKLEQIESLNSLATSASVAFGGMPSSGGRGGSRVERAVIKIIELEDALKDDVEDMVDLKRRIMADVRKVENPEQQVLLEKRYLSFLNWDRIATDMHYSVQHVYRIHDDALEAVGAIMRARERD